jgi:hypothetical protein
MEEPPCGGKRINADGLQRTIAFILGCGNTLHSGVQREDRNDLTAGSRASVKRS